MRRSLEKSLHLLAINRVFECSTFDSQVLPVGLVLLCAPNPLFRLEADFYSCETDEPFKKRINVFFVCVFSCDLAIFTFFSAHRASLRWKKKSLNAFHWMGGWWTGIRAEMSRGGNIYKIYNLMTSSRTGQK